MLRNPKCTCALNRYIVRGNHPDAAITQSHFEVIFADRSCFNLRMSDAQRNGDARHKYGR